MSQTVRRRGTGLVGALVASLMAVGGAVAVPAAANAAPGDEGTVADATLDWGVKQSFRNYLLNMQQLTHGSYVLLGDVTADAEMGAASGQFHWGSGEGSGAIDGSTADVSFGSGNGVHFTGHYMEVGDDSGHALDMQFTNPRVEVTSATEGTLYLDVRSREFEGMTSISDNFFEEENVPFASLELSAPEQSGDTFTWTNAAATLTDQGSTAFGGFYNSGEALDSVSFTLPVTEPEEPVVWEPQISVFLEDGATSAEGVQLQAGDTIVVKGSGFDPQANIGGRGMPIPNHLPQGVYVVFGDFAEDWQPSEGAAGATRASGAQGWVLTENTLDQVPAQFQNVIRGQWIPQNEDGSFEGELTISTPDGDNGNNFGVYTYGAGGVNNADQELAAPLAYSTFKTSLELSVSPAAIELGESVELVAAVSSDSEDELAGTVQFFNGSTAIGEPVEVVEGVAALETAELPAGDQSLRAEFTAADVRQFSASVSADVVVEVVDPNAGNEADAEGDASGNEAGAEGDASGTAGNGSAAGNSGQGGAAAAGGAKGGLATTGAENLAGAAIAAMMVLALGAGLMAARRRKVTAE